MLDDYYITTLEEVERAGEAAYRPGLDVMVAFGNWLDAYELFNIPRASALNVFLRGYDIAAFRRVNANSDIVRQPMSDNDEVESYDEILVAIRARWTNWYDCAGDSECEQGFIDVNELLNHIQDMQASLTETDRIIKEVFDILTDYKDTDPALATARNLLLSRIQKENS